MKRTALRRKTRLKNNSGGLKRSGRLRGVGKNSKKNQDKSQRARYLSSFPVCELIPLSARIGTNGRDHAKRAVDPHHIVGGVGGRSDDWCNLISVCRECHDAVQHDAYGTLLCLVAKKRKGELDVERLNELRGLHIVELLRIKMMGVPRELFAELDSDETIQSAVDS